MSHITEIVNFIRQICPEKPGWVLEMEVVNNCSPFLREIISKAWNDDFIDRCKVASAIVSGCHDFDPLALNRRRPFVLYRQSLCLCLRIESGMGIMAIGKEIRRDHATVLHSISFLENDLGINERERNRYISVYRDHELIKTADHVSKLNDIKHQKREFNKKVNPYYNV